MLGDGNCFYRVLSVLLTGSENTDNAAEIRRDITQYIYEEVRLHSIGLEEHNWWQLFHPAETSYTKEGEEVIN